MKNALVVVCAVQLAALLLGVGLWVGSRNRAPQPVVAVAPPAQAVPVAPSVPTLPAEPPIPAAPVTSATRVTSDAPHAARRSATVVREPVARIESEPEQEQAGPADEDLALPSQQLVNPPAGGVGNAARKSVERGVSGIIDGLFGRANEKVVGKRKAAPEASATVPEAEVSEEVPESPGVDGDEVEPEVAPEDPPSPKAPGASRLGSGAINLIFKGVPKHVKALDAVKKQARVKPIVTPHKSKQDTTAQKKARAAALKLAGRLPGR